MFQFHQSVCVCMWKEIVRREEGRRRDHCKIPAPGARQYVWSLSLRMNKKEEVAKDQKHGSQLFVMLLPKKEIV